MQLWEGDIPLYNEKNQNSDNIGAPSLDLYLLDEKNGGGYSRGIVMVCPGGAYAFRAEHEGKGMAEFLNQNGFHAAVLNYRVAPYRYPAAFYDAVRGIRQIRYHAQEWGIDENKIAVMGSSAGGHLAGMLATCYMDAPIEGDELCKVSARPNLAILCYPVITSGFYTHEGSMKNIIGDCPTMEMLKKVSVDKCVTCDTPPMLIWHTCDDEAVPMQNSLLLAQSLREKGVPVTLHIYEHGHHGLGLAKGTECESWSGLMLEWLKKHEY